MNKHLFWLTGSTVLVLMIMNFSYIYHSQPDAKLFMKIIKKSRQFVKTGIEENSIPPCAKLPNATVIDKPKPLTGMWTVHGTGRLGNVMGEYATLYALAKMNGHQAYISQGMHDQLSRIFKIRLPVIHNEAFDHIKWRYYRLHDWMSKEYRHIEGEYVHFIGSPGYFTLYHHIRDEILQEFTFLDHIRIEAINYLDKARGDKKNVTFVGIHVRRGDYIQFMPQSLQGVLADKGYLEKAMKYFRNKYQNPLFVVTSNGMDWCKENINSSLGDVHFAGDGNEGSPGRDFAILVHCNHTIMTVGTFGIWAGYMAGGETVYLINFTLPDAPFLDLFKYEAAYLPEWIGIPADLSPLLNAKKNKA